MNIWGRFRCDPKLCIVAGWIAYLSLQIYRQEIAIMETKEEKLKELQKVQAEMDKLQAELDRLNTKVKSNEKLTVDETKFFGELGWLSALAVTIAAIASTI
jgi:uncharacterized protein YlxW (UPF0749 family)